MQRQTSTPLHPEAPAADGASLKYNTSTIHPVQTIERDAATIEKTARRKLMASAYGSALPMRLMMHEHMLSQCHRLPGLPSSFVGLDSYTGRDEKLDFEDFLNLPQDAPDMPRDQPRDILERTLRIPSASTLK